MCQAVARPRLKQDVWHCTSGTVPNKKTAWGVTYCKVILEHDTYEFTLLQNENKQNNVRDSLRGVE